jgi:hypothetical protein
VCVGVCVHLVEFVPLPVAARPARHILLSVFGFVYLRVYCLPVCLSAALVRCVPPRDSLSYFVVRCQFGARLEKIRLSSVAHGKHSGRVRKKHARGTVNGGKLQ